MFTRNADQFARDNYKISPKVDANGQKTPARRSTPVLHTNVASCGVGGFVHWMGNFRIHRRVPFLGYVIRRRWALLRL